MSYTCPRCGGLLDPATQKFLNVFVCKCPKEQTTASSNSTTMSAEKSKTPSTDALIEATNELHKAQNKDDFAHYFDMAGVLAMQARALEKKLLATEKHTAELLAYAEEARKLLKLVQIETDRIQTKNRIYGFLSRPLPTLELPKP